MNNTGVKCDVCKQPVVWSEIFGWLHQTKDRPFGIAPSMDNANHKPQCRNGWDK